MLTAWKVSVVRSPSGNVDSIKPEGPGNEWQRRSMLMFRRYLWSGLVVITAFGGLVWFWANPTSIENPATKPEVAQALPPVDSRLASSVNAVHDNAALPPTADASAPLQARDLWSSKFRRLDRMFPAGEPGHEPDHRTDVAELTALAGKGDSAAALDLHRIVSGCIGSGGQATSSECRNLPEAIRADPQRWILLAGQLGDPRAALPIYGLARDAIGTASNTQHAAELKSAALDVLEKSVSAGSADALALLWNVYSDGRLAQPDPVKAFAYLDGYAQATGDTVAADEAAKLWLVLRSADRTAARAIQTSLLNGVKSP